MSIDGYTSIRKYVGTFDHLNTTYFNADGITVGSANFEGDVVIDVNSNNALEIRKNNDGDSVFLVDTINSKVDINGDLNVIGTLTYQDQTAFATNDNLLIAGIGNLLDNVDTGILFNYNDTKYTGLYRDANDGEYHLVEEVGSLPVTSVGAFNYATLNLDNLKINELYFDTTRVTSNGTQKITLDFDADHGYVEIFTSNEVSRSAYIGYPGSLNNNLTIANERTSGDIRLVSNGNILLNGNNVVSDISTNASSIATNASNISTNAGNISTNASSIATNNGNINLKLNKAGDTMTGLLNMNGNSLDNVVNINTDYPLSINNDGSSTTPYFRLLDSGGYAYIQAGNLIGGNYYMRLTGINGNLLNLFRVDTNQTYSSFSTNVYTDNSLGVASNTLNIVSNANDSNHNQASLSLTTAGGTLSLQAGYDNDPPGNSYNYARLINTTGNILEMPSLNMNGNDITNAETIGMVNSNIFSNTSLNTMEFSNNGGLAFYIDTALSMNMNIDMLNRSIENCADPSSAQDVATKNYVDNHRVPSIICRFYGVNVSSSWNTFSCNMDDVSNNINTRFYSPYNVLVKKLVFQFDGDVNSSQVFECELSGSSSFTTATGISGIPASQTGGVFADLSLADPSKEFSADEGDSIYLRGRFSSADDAEVTVTCWGYIWE